MAPYDRASNGMARFNGKLAGYAAKLPHSTQIANQLANMEMMKDGQDIRKWSLSARKELTSAGNVNALIKKEASPEMIEAYERLGNQFPPQDMLQGFAAPKLAMVVISSHFRDYLEKNPEAKEVKVANERITVTALATLIDFIKDATTVRKIKDIVMPADMCEALDIRVAAELLSMGQYVSHFVSAYKTQAWDSVPAPQQTLTIVEHAIGGKDDVLVVAYASRLAHLYRANLFSTDQKDTWDALRAYPDFQILNEAIADADTRSGQKQQNGAVQNGGQTEEQRIAEARKKKLELKAAKQVAKAMAMAGTTGVDKGTGNGVFQLGGDVAI
jgi:hypothetical protein